MSRLILCDLDGVLADNRHRLHFITPPEHDWEAFYAAMGDDTIISPVAHLLDAMRHYDRPLVDETRVIFVTGRPERYRLQTVDWLTRHAVERERDYETMLMRPDDDPHRPAADLKRDFLAQVGGPGVVLLAIDDDPRVVTMYRKAGVFCLAWR